MKRHTNKSSAMRSKPPKNMSWREYESLIHRLAAGLSKSSGLVADEPPGLGNKIQGKSGIRHQIDVSLRSKESAFLWIIECKHWKKKVGLPTVLAFQGRLVDIRENNEMEVFGSLMTKIGFTGPASKYASAYKFDTGLAKNNAEFVLRFKKGNVQHIFIGEKQAPIR